MIKIQGVDLILPSHYSPLMSNVVISLQVTTTVAEDEEIVWTYIWQYAGSQTYICVFNFPDWEVIQGYVYKVSIFLM